jgi:hypothetical protein
VTRERDEEEDQEGEGQAFHSSEAKRAEEMWMGCGGFNLPADFVAGCASSEGGRLARNILKPGRHIAETLRV